VTVALTGDGGDELFLGYGSYTWAGRVRSYSFLSPFAQAVRSASPSLNKAAKMLERPAAGSIRDHIFSAEQGFFTYKELDDLLVDRNLSPVSYNDPRGSEDLSEAEKQALFDVTHYLKDDLLVKVDRASMYYSLECRCPLLDPEVVSFALNLPREFKLRSNTSKYLMKKLLVKFLPEDLVYRKKWGFGIPLGSWLRNDLRYLIGKYLSKDVVEEFNFVKVSAVNNLVSKFLGGDNTLAHKLWVLIVIHFWFKHNAKA
jgi:asparagine synthase (glutamine-hydrolysing)